MCGRAGGLRSLSRELTGQKIGYRYPQFNERNLCTTVPDSLRGPNRANVRSGPRRLGGISVARSRKTVESPSSRGTACEVYHPASPGLTSPAGGMLRTAARRRPPQDPCEPVGASITRRRHRWRMPVLLRPRLRRTAGERRQPRTPATAGRRGRRGKVECRVAFRGLRMLTGPNVQRGGEGWH